MIKKALEYIVGLGKPEIMEIGGQHWSDKTLERVCHNPKAAPVRMRTLTSLVDYIKAGVDEMPGRMVVHVEGPLKVSLYSQLDGDRTRETLVEVVGEVPEFKYGRYISQEEFVVSMQSKFIQTETRDAVIRFAGAVENGTVKEYGDDGCTQKATVRKGIASKAEAIVPNPVALAPFRTFLEVGQPGSQFIFRMRDDGDGGVECAIFEADGGAWRNEAAENVKEYLERELGGMEGFTVIS